MTGRIFDIARCSYVDGPGVRSTVFFKGCNLRCRWCHNPEGQRYEKELLFFRDKCSGCGACQRVCQHPEHCIRCGDCAAVCPADARRLCGKDVYPEEILAVLRQDKPFFDATGGGATFSGGECMLQRSFLTELLMGCRRDGICSAVDTAGDVPWDELETVMPLADLFLYDIKCITPSLHREWTGAENAQILENARRLLDRCPEKLLFRVPVIPGFNDSQEEQQRICDFLHPYGKEPELLPYHAMGVNKARALGEIPFEVTAPDRDEMERYRALYRN